MNGIMIQGTSSDSGKSFIVTGLCRLLHRMGMNICPFKSQNMSNNSTVTLDGLEISTAQAVQARAAGLTPSAFMNPILLKPRHDRSSEVVLNGHVFSSDTDNYRHFSQNEGISAVRQALRHIQAHYQAVIIEGAGSPAEVNLNSCEIVNMRIAREADVLVFLVADVDRGGSLASVVGTLELLGTDRERVKGIIYNKFRGNMDLFRSAVEWTEDYTGIKVVGVIPYVKDVSISGEDSLNIKDTMGGNIHIGIMNFPGISNFNDFDAFTHEPDVSLTYIDGNTSIKTFHGLDAIILPGTKNTFAALSWLRETGLDVMIRNFPGYVFGICGGLQILGRELLDPELRETGLGLLPVCTVFENSKVVRQREVIYQGTSISGYEIHYDRSKYDYDSGFKELFTVEGIMSEDFRLAGTYLHGVFSNDVFRSSWLNRMRSTERHTNTTNDNSFDVIADVLAQSLDMDFILSLILHEDTKPQLE